jgi:hypothetical protein
MKSPRPSVFWDRLLSAAYQTVPAERGMHSLHAYFLRPGDPVNPFAPDNRKPLRYAWFKAVAESLNARESGGFWI